MSKLINKYLSIADLKLIKELKLAIKNDSLSITCIGLYNHGKSTLLNCLVKDFENKTFATADVRKTATNKTIQFGTFTYIDTPGLNANKHDDKRVMDAIKKSDINLFVHTVTTGELVAKEIEFLNNIKKYWKNPQEFISRTIFVISRIDKANNKQDIDGTIKKIAQQIEEIFKLKPTIIPISSTRYIKGRLENKPLMTKKSNIELLENSLKNLSDKLANSIKEDRKNRLKNKYDDLIKQLNSKVQTNKLEIAKHRQAQKKYFSNLDSDIKQVEDTLTNMYAELERN
ncbi:50S ribosome-binding GTPase [Sulfurimonas sp. SWIR-19]|uniref:GTPase n=1 Tax=Sulfurimonas sp. SWIR-19 TaxID=2878390 RepID=UPI001CF28DED|nr:GTPase [Sulfurimonas sp. SWIR-19]UCN00126.1 50S ribosome-binding GTPase [Sulfurimonas sp. SWIR-19]